MQLKDFMRKTTIEEEKIMNNSNSQDIEPQVASASGEDKDVVVSGTGEVTVDLSAEINNISITMSNPVISDLDDKKIIRYDLSGNFTLTNSMELDVADPVITSILDGGA